MADDETPRSRGPDAAAIAWPRRKLAELWRLPDEDLLEQGPLAQADYEHADLRAQAFRRRPSTPSARDVEPVKAFEGHGACHYHAAQPRNVRRGQELWAAVRVALGLATYARE